MADERARALRKRLTPQEVKLWQALRLLRPLGHHFRRQSPIGDFVVDFECRRARLILEVDGGQHAVSRTDAARDAALAAAGYEVFRVWNCDVDESLEGVVETILQRIISADATQFEMVPTRRAKKRAHPPLAGEG